MGAPPSITRISNHQILLHNTHGEGVTFAPIWRVPPIMVTVFEIFPSGTPLLARQYNEGWTMSSDSTHSG